MSRNIIIFTLAVCLPAPAFAGYSFAPSPTGGAPTAASDTKGTASPAPAASPSINPAANTGNSSQSSGAGANAAAAMAMMAAALPMLANPATAPMGAALMALAALAAMQAGADQGAADQSAQTAAASANTTTPTTPITTPYSAGTATSAYNPLTNKAAQQALNDAGYTLTPTTMTTPDGTSSSLSSLGSSDGLSAAGLDPKALAEAQKIAANAGAGPSVSGVAVADGGGGGSAKNGNQITLPELPAIKFNNPFALKPGDKAAIIAGKTVNYDGEPIGVRGGDIFEMVHQAYDKRSQRGNFITSDSGSDRMPASTAKAVPAYVPAVIKNPSH